MINIRNGYSPRLVSPSNPEELAFLREVADVYGKQLSNLMSSIKGAPSEAQDNAIRIFAENIASHDKTNLFARWASQNASVNTGQQEQDTIEDLGLTD